MVHRLGLGLVLASVLSAQPLARHSAEWNGCAMPLAMR
jgi:hypothetical protein